MSATFNLPALAERELIIDVNPEGGWVQYEGSREQLEAEGLIPDNFKWPRAAGDQRWSAGGFDYWLRRTRPSGHKGPMRSWLELDNWFVRVTVTGRDHFQLKRRSLERKSAELSAEFHAQTAAGQREANARFNRAWAARSDQAFQAFKSSVIPERKRLSRARNGHSGAAES